MKVLVSRRSSIPRLDICLVLICCIVLTGSRLCGARTVSHESATAIEQPHEDKGLTEQTGHADLSDKTKSAIDDAVIGERPRRESSSGKSTKASEDTITKDASINRGSEKDKKLQVSESADSHLQELQEKQSKGFKRVIKRPIRRLKRSDDVSNEKSIQSIEDTGKIVEDKVLQDTENVEQTKGINVDGIRRLDVEVEDDEKKEVQEASKIINEESVATKDADIVENVKADVDVVKESEELPKVDAVEDTPELSSEKLIENSAQDSVDTLNSPQEESPADNDKMTLARAESFSRLQFLKAQALEFQDNIRNNTFLQSLKSQMSDILPDIPKFTETQFHEMLKTIMLKKNIDKSSDFDMDALRSNGLNDEQIEIVKCAQQLVAQKERQSFFDNMSECIRGLNVINCMRIFIYPIIVENMPEALIQGLPNFPIEINVPDLLQGNRDKTKSARQVPLIGFYTSAVDPDAVIFNILMEGLLKNPPNENLPSFIEAKNETLSKILTCNRLQILQMTEKFLPEKDRQFYSDEMLSCVKRFEYFSCIKYFSWPAIKQYYPALPEFPLSDSYLSSLIYPNYPLVTYPGFESGFSHLPEVIESGPRIKPETVIMRIFSKTLSEYSKISTPPTPIQLDSLFKGHHSINKDQIATIHLAEQLLPVFMRTEYVHKTAECIRHFDYYNCIRYVTWPLVRQFNPSIPEFPNFQDILNNFQIPNIPQIPNLFEFFSQFQIPQFQLPQFQIPEIPNLSIPDFSQFFPFGPQSTTTPKPPENPSTESPPADTPQDSVEDSKKNNTALESNIYKILKNVRDSMGATPLSPATYTNRKVFLFPLMTEEQSKIFALAESLVPPIAREPLITNVYFCLNDKNKFTTCAKTFMWPMIRNYVKDFPEFPMESDNLYLQQKIDASIPTLPFSGGNDNFFIMREIEKFFFEGREDAMAYIIRSLQLSKPESFNLQTVLQLLRTIQFNMPEFLNVQTIKYPRTPEFSTLLTENQENIVHAVESITPDEIRQKFYSDMIDCAQKNKFPMCSRNIIFPIIYPYFQRALSFPLFNVFPERSNFSKVHMLDLNRIQPVRIETKVNTEKQGSNIVFNTDRTFMPLYPSNPESVIFNMLRKTQMTAPSLPNFPEESLVNTPEFKQAFSNKQAHILTVAEGILPEEYRKGLLEEMYKCNKNNTFLNCTRDVIFPAMMKAYPDFPAFPDFENELNRSNMLAIIDSLKKPSSMPRSYDSKRTLPSMEFLYQFLPEDKIETLRILVDKLPDSLYYDLYVKMYQCTQYSDSISCGHDIVYPTMKKYYDAEGFKIDDYYPVSFPIPIVSNQRQPFNHEIVCHNMGLSCTLIPSGLRYSDGAVNLNPLPGTAEITYIPFGRLGDGTRIFKQSQEVWNPNTSSVEADKTINIKRKKRNVDDLLDSYPHTIPENKKNSVPRRIPPKLIFPNLTETELLQILVHVSKLKKEWSLENRDVTFNEYYVDTLNDTEKASLTADQYEILKLVQGLNVETSRASFMSRLVQCIRSLSFLRCVGIFVWPMIQSNLPSLPFTRDSRAAEEINFEQVFGMSKSELEAELINRKEQFESNFIQWYKSLTEDKYEIIVGPLKLKGQGDGQLAISFASFREGRLSKLKDNKNVPSILTIISEVIEEVFDTKPNKSKNKKDTSKKDKRSRSLHSLHESKFEKFLNNVKDVEEEEIEENGSKKSVKDDQVINMLIEKMRPTEVDIENEDARHYFNLEDAYRAFQVLFGPKVTEKLSNQLKTIKNENFENLDKIYHELPNDNLKVLSLDAQAASTSDESKIVLPKSRAIYEFDKENDNLNKVSKLKSCIADYLKRYIMMNKKKIQKGLILRLPKLDEDIANCKVTSSLNHVGRSMKSKMQQMMPLAGLTVSFLVQLALSHAKAAASVAGMLSNMALGSAMISLVRDMIFGMNNQPKIKYIYDTEKYDTGISWPQVNTADSTMNYNNAPPTDMYAPPTDMYAPPPHFH